MYKSNDTSNYLLAITLLILIKLKPSGKLSVVNVNMIIKPTSKYFKY